MTIRLKAAFEALSKRLTPLALRLAAVACALMLPILWYASVVQAKLDASIAERQAEAASVRWILMADQLAARQNLRRLSYSRATERIAVARRIAGMRAYANEFVAALPTATLATTQIEIAWNALVRAPTSKNFANVSTATFQANSTVSYDSRLSAESDVVLADFGDALSNAYFLVYAPLTSAAQTTLLGWRHGQLSLSDRILIAGNVALAESSGAPLSSDMVSAFRAEPALAERIGPAYRHALAGSASLARKLDAAAGSQARRGDPSQLAAENDLFRQSTDELLVKLADAAIVRTDTLAAQTRRAETRLYVQTTIAVVLELCAVVYAGRMIVRRYSRDLERAKEQARVLSAELARQQAEHARMLTEAQFDAVFDRSQMGIALLDRNGRTMECNPALSEILGRTTPTIVPANDPRFAKLIAGFEPTYQYEGPLSRGDGTVRWAQITVSSIDVPTSEAVAAIAIVQDITDRKAIDERLRFQAGHDDLTLLPNRTQFLRKLDGLLIRGTDLGRYAVLFVDLDKFKLVNDTLGHTAGDRVLAIAAQRLVAATRPGDIVARLHGDEFAVVVSENGNTSPGETVADRIKKTFLAPISIDGTAVVLSASVGIVPGLTGYEAAENVLRDADVAMYNAKKLGRSTAVRFDGAMHERLGTHMRMLTEIRLAIEREEFKLVYQPIVDLVSGNITGVEALMRWYHPTLGVVSPVEFIPIAEETDAIEYLGRLALRETCAMLARMDAAGMEPITASVNLSVPHLSNGEVVSDLRNVLEASNIRASRLMLEITESALLENGTRAAKVLDELAAVGVRLCIDDFGTGYSSLRYLHEYPIAALKIDRSFIYAPDGSIANGPIVHMLLTLARSLNMAAIAEGIESETQRQVLIAGGCRFAQGYLFSRPLSEANLLQWIRAGSQSAANAASVTVA